MADLPYMKFFPADWLADCDVLSMAARGAWITFLSKAWISGSNGEITLKISQWARVYGAPNAEQAERAIAEIEECEVGDVTRHGDGRITITSRRIARDLREMREGSEKKSAAGRKAAQARWRKDTDAEPMRDACDAHENALPNDAIPKAIVQKLDSEGESKAREREIPTSEECEAFARSHLPNHAEFAESVAREFHGVFSSMQPPWITRGGDDLTRSQAWKHKLKSKLENELRNQIGRRPPQGNRSNRQNAGNGSKSKPGAGEGIKVNEL